MLNPTLSPFQLEQHVHAWLLTLIGGGKQVVVPQRPANSRPSTAQRPSDVIVAYNFRAVHYLGGYKQANSIFELRE